LAEALQTTEREIIKIVLSNETFSGENINNPLTEAYMMPLQIASWINLDEVGCKLIQNYITLSRATAAMQADHA
jgi:hypothetical protein